MPSQYTRAQLEAMSTGELVKLYNTISGNRVERFSSRKVGISKLLQALIERAKSSPKTVRNVRNGKPAEKIGKSGRPSIAYAVQVQEAGKSEVMSKSLRGQLIAHLKGLSEGTATILDLEAKFGPKIKGAVQKLMSVGWLKRIEQPAS